MSLSFFIAGGCVGLGLGTLIGTLIGYKLSIKDDKEIKQVIDVKQKDGE